MEGKIKWPWLRQFKIISSIANGFRLGFVTNLPNKRDSIGLSLGYVSGPAGKISFTQSDLISPWEISASQEIAFDFYRFLAEYERAYFSLNKIEGRIGLGIGLAMGKATSKTTIYDTTASFSPFPSNYMLVVQSKSVVGFTWEIGPEVVFKGERANLVFGVTFSGFPYFEEDGWMFESKWHPVGVKIGVEF
ncbi:MAG: hypothetical protein IPN65_04360 [Elusimicrobia bacterium]|nr:hypothetical protein [Elusimicrobiota bacterium]